MQDIKQGSTYNLLSPNFPNPYPTEEIDCRWIISGNTKFSVNFNSFELADGSDYLEIRDGQRKDGELLAYFTNDTFNPSQHIFSNQAGLWIRFATDSGPSGRGFSASVVSEKLGGYYKGKGSISMPKAKAVPSTAYAYLLRVAADEQVQLNIDAATLSPNSQLWIYNGYDEAKSQLLDILVSNDQFYDVVSTGSKMMVLARSFSSPNSFQAKFKGIPYGYHNVSTGDVGIKTVDSLYYGNLTWTIRPLKLTKETMLIALTIATLQLKDKDRVRVYPLISRTTPLLTCDATNMEMSTIYVPIVQGIRVEIERSYKYAKQLTVFAASYAIVPRKYLKQCSSRGS